MSIGFRDFL